MSVVSMLDIYVSHVESDGPLLKLWVQQDRQSVVLIEQYIQILRQHFDAGKGVPHHSALTTNSLCCARYSDGEYYRAKIMNLNNIAQGKVALHFIDYGNCETVNVADIRLLEMYNANPLNGLSEQAEDFYLAGVVPPSGTWGEEVIKFIKSKICYVDMKGTVIGRFGSKRMVKLLLHNEDFANFLISQDYCHPVKLQAQQSIAAQRHQVPMFAGFTVPPPVVQPGLFPVPPGNVVRPPTISQPPPPTLQPQPQPQPQPVQHKTASLIFTSPLLEFHSQHEVYVSFVEDGPISFSIQLKENEPILHKLMDTIRSLPQVIVSGPLFPGSVCLGRYSSDKMLCRSVITSVQADSCTVYYVDFGNSEVLPYSEIFSLPAELVEPKVMALRFTLYAVKDLGDITDDVKEVFSELVTNKLLVMRVTPSDGPPLKQYCELFDGGKNIKELIVARLKGRRKVESYRPMPLLKVGQSTSVVVSYVEMPSSFYVQFERTNAQLASLMISLQNHCMSASPVPLARLRAGLPCCALYSEDGKWYRAQVQSHSPTEVYVLYVDYGNTDMVVPGQLKEINVKLAEVLEPQAMSCCLKGFEGDILPEMTNDFEQLVLDKVLRMVVVQMTKGVAIVELYNEVLDIGAHLLCPSQPTPPASTGLRLDIPSATTDSASPQERQDKGWSSAKEPSSQRPPRFESAEQDSWKKKNDSNKSWQKHDRDGEDRPWQKRDRDGEDKPWQKRDRDGNDKSWQKRDRDGEDKPWQKRGDDHKWGNRHDEDGNKGNWGDKMKQWDRDNSGHFIKKRDSGFSSDGRSGGKSFGGQGNRGSKFQSSNFLADTEEQRRDKSMVHAPAASVPVLYGSLTPPIIAAGETRTVEVVYTTNPHDFYVQVMPDCEPLAALMTRIDEVYGAGGGTPIANVQAGTTCIAKYLEDEQWYRVVVQSVNGQSAHIFFSDFGNQADVPICELVQMVAEFQTLPVQAVKCSLAGTAPPGPTWTDGDFTSFTTATELKQLEATFVCERGGSYEVHLKDVETGQIINEAYSSAVATMVAPLQSTAPKDYAGTGDLFPGIEITAGTTVDVGIMWFISPEEFYCQLTSSEAEIKTMMKELQVAYSSGPPQNVPPEVGRPVVVRFKTDKVLYRAVVEHISSGMCVIQYVDYGNREQVLQTEIQGLEKRFLLPPRQGLLCTLRGVQPAGGATWPLGQSPLDQCFDADTLRCTFHELSDSGVYLVSLQRGGQDVADELVEKGFAEVTASAAPVEPETVLPVDPQLLVGMTLRANMCFIESTGNFFVHLDLPSVDHIQSLVWDVIKNPQGTEAVPKDSLVAGTLCVTTPDSESWYRGEIVGCPDAEGVPVQFVDYGDQQTIPRDKILLCPPSLAGLARQAVACHLHVAGAVTPELEEQFKAELETQDVIVRVEGCSDNRMSVLVFNVNGKVHSFLEGLLDGPSEVEPLCPFLVMTKARVRVSHVGGAKNVWLQRTSHDEALTTLVEQMFAYYETEAKGNDVEVTAGVLCAAKSPTDGNWYRARVVSAEGEAINVHFLDYGNGEVVPPACVKALDEMFHLPNLMSVSVALPIILVIPEEELVEKVAELTADKDFVALFSRDGDRLVADLVKDSVSISKQLSESGAVSLLPGYTNMVEEETKAVTAEDKCVVFVSFIESPVEFWVQVASNAAAIEGLQAELQSVAENLWAVKEMPSLGELVAVMFSDDDNWYRGKVMTVDGTSLTVCFVDYGNTEVVDFASSDIKHLPENLKGLPHFATRCKFDLVPPSGSEWGTEALERFENLVADTGGPFVIKTLYEDEVKHVEMLVDNTNFKDVLVSEGLAIQCTPAVAIPERPTPIGSKREQVFVCHGTSPSQFWVRREEDSEKIDSMMSRLSEAEHYPTVDEPLEEKQLVVVRHEDEMWYRASVIVPEEKKVLFVDYGSETCTTDVRLLPLDLAAMPPLARSCSLKLPSSLQEWPITLDAEFEALAAEGTACFEMEVVLEEDPATVIMYLDGKSVADVLLALCEPEIVLPDSVPTSYPEIQLDNAGVCVSYRTSPSEFWLQNASSAEMLAKLGEWLASAEGFPELQDLGEGMFCAAKFEEVNMWFRGRVVGTSDDGISVLFVDYGNTAVCRELRALPANLERVPPLARFCQLLLLPGASGWSPLACETFLDSTTDITKVFQVEVVDDDDPVIVKLSHDGNDIFHGIAVDSLIIPDMGSDDDILELENIKIQIPAECEVTPKLSDEGAEAKQSGAALQETAVLDVRDVHTAGEDDGVSKGPQVVLSIEGEVDASTAMAKSSEGGAIVSSIMSTLVEGEVDSLLESTEESFKEDNLYVSRTQVSEFTVDGTKEAVCKITCNEMPVNVAMPDIQARTLGSEGRSMADECVTKSEIEDVGVNFANSDTLEVDDASELETEDVDINAPNLEKIVLHETEAAIVIACGSEASNIEVGVSKTEHEELNLSAANLKTDFEVNDVKLENLRLGEPVINDEDINSVQLDVSDVEGYVSDLEMEDTKSNTVESGLMGVMEAENITKSVNAESSKCVHNLSADISMDSTDKEMEPKTFSRSETAESSERVCNLSADLSVDPADQKMEAENISKSETAESSERVCNLSVDISVDPTGKEKEPKIVKSETAEASECVHNLLADVVNRADHRSVELSGERDALLEVQCGDALRGSELEEQVAAVVGVNGVRTGNQEIHQATAYSTVKQATGSEAKQRVEETEEDFEDAVEEEQQDGDSSMKKATLSGRQTEHLERIVQDIPVEMKTPSVGSPAHLPRVTAEFKRVPSRPGSPRCDNTERILPGCVSGNSENGS